MAAVSFEYLVMPLFIAICFSLEKCYRKLVKTLQLRDIDIDIDIVFYFKISLLILILLTHQ